MFSDDFAICGRCSALFRPILGQELCEKCLVTETEHMETVERAVNSGIRTIPELVDATGIPRRELQRLLRQMPSLRNQVFTDKTCVRCKNEQAQIGFDICLPCRQILFEAFQKQSKKISENIKAEIKELNSPGKLTKSKGVASVASSLKDRRTQSFTKRHVPRFISDKVEE